MTETIGHANVNDERAPNGYNLPDRSRQWQVGQRTEVARGSSAGSIEANESSLLELIFPDKRISRSEKQVASATSLVKRAVPKSALIALLIGARQLRMSQRYAG